MKLEFENFIIERVDAKNIIIKELKKVKSKETGEFKEEWQVEGYYGRIEIALKALLGLKISNSNAETAKEILMEINKAKEEIIGVLTI